MKKITGIISVMVAVSLMLQCFAFSCSAADSDTGETNFVVLGDSIAAGTKLFNADVQCYGALLAKTNGWNYLNYAVPGHTTYAFSSRLDEDEVREAVSEADIIAVSIGGNNFLLNGLVEMVADGLLYKDYSKMDEITDAFYVSFDECILKIKALNPTAELFVQTLYNPMPGTIGEVYSEGVTRLNNAIKKYASENPGAYTVIDVEPEFEGHSGYIATDFIHPNKNGHLVIAGEYQKTFYEMGLTDSENVEEPTFSEIMTIDLKKAIEDFIFQITNSLNLMFGGLAAG